MKFIRKNLGVYESFIDKDYVENYKYSEQKTLENKLKINRKIGYIGKIINPYIHGSRYAHSNTFYKNFVAAEKIKLLKYKKESKKIISLWEIEVDSKTLYGEYRDSGKLERLDVTELKNYYQTSLIKKLKREEELDISETTLDKIFIPLIKKINKYKKKIK